MKKRFIKIVLPFLIGTIGIIILIDNYNEESKYDFLKENGVVVEGKVVKVERVSMGTSGVTWYIWVRYLDTYLIHNEITINKLIFSVGDSIPVVYEKSRPTNGLLELDLTYDFTKGYIVGFLMSCLLPLSIINFLRRKS